MAGGGGGSILAMIVALRNNKNLLSKRTSFFNRKRSNIRLKTSAKKRMTSFLDRKPLSEEQIKIREPLLYHMYIGRFQRNGDCKPDSLMITDIAFQRLDQEEYKKALKSKYSTNKDFFKGQLDEAMETDKDGEPLKLSAD